MECKNKSDTKNKYKGNWNHLKIIQKTPVQHTETARNQRTTENSYIVHCTHTWERTSVKVQNIQHGK